MDTKKIFLVRAIMGYTYSYFTTSLISCVLFNVVILQSGDPHSCVHALLCPCTLVSCTLVSMHSCVLHSRVLHSCVLALSCPCTLVSPALFCPDTIAMHTLQNDTDNDNVKRIPLSLLTKMSFCFTCIYHCIVILASSTSTVIKLR